MELLPKLQNLAILKQCYFVSWNISCGPSQDTIHYFSNVIQDACYIPAFPKAPESYVPKDVQAPSGKAQLLNRVSVEEESSLLKMKSRSFRNRALSWCKAHQCNIQRPLYPSFRLLARYHSQYPFILAWLQLMLSSKLD